MSGKKTEKLQEPLTTPLDGGTAETDDAEKTVAAEEAVPTEPDRLEEIVSEETPIEETPVILLLSSGEAEIIPPSEEETAPDPQALPEDTPLETAPEGSPANPPAIIAPMAPTPAKRPSFFSFDFKGDRELSADQQREWNAIYASFRSKSILTGTVIGVDQNTFAVKNPESGQMEEKMVRSLVIVDYRVKVLIPEFELWADGEERPDYIVPHMIGAKVDYVVVSVDREGGCAVGSRRSALIKRRRHFLAREHHETGDLLKCSLLVVGPGRVIAECNGFDVPMTRRDLSYTTLLDLREHFRPGQELDAKLKELHPAAGQMVLSVKEVNPNPFVGADVRHPVGCRRQALISGKYAGGVFCSMPDGTVCLCLYSNELNDAAFYPGDNVLVHIVKYDYNRELIYGRIITKW